jgi:hypothetical protein
MACSRLTEDNFRDANTKEQIVTELKFKIDE